MHEQKGWDRKRWVAVPKGRKQHCYVWAWLRNALVDTGWAVSLFLCTIELRRLSSHFPCLAFTVWTLNRLKLTKSYSLEATLSSWGPKHTIF